MPPPTLPVFSAVRRKVGFCPVRSKLSFGQKSVSRLTSQRNPFWGQKWWQRHPSGGHRCQSFWNPGSRAAVARNSSRQCHAAVWVSVQATWPPMSFSGTCENSVRYLCFLLWLNHNTVYLMFSMKKTEIIHTHPPIKILSENINKN